MHDLLSQIRNCTLCAPYLADGPNPIVQASRQSKIVVVGQAPGRIVHASGIPWDDKSGDNLRKWMGVEKADFYNAEKIALVPMGFCYPGTSKSGDLPPRPECAPLWHSKLMDSMPYAVLILLVGQYAQGYYLKAKSDLTSTVRNFEEHLPTYFPLPHPSPRNNIWLAKNPWFGEEVLPRLKSVVKDLLA